MPYRQETARRPLPNPGWGSLAALPGNPLMWVLITWAVLMGLTLTPAPR